MTMVRYKTRELLARALWKEVRFTISDLSGYTRLVSSFFWIVCKG